jgi:hypothetical protein
VSRKHPQTQSEQAPEQVSVARLEQLRANYEASRKAGRWQKPLLTDEQRQIAAQLLTELALLEEQERSSEGV